MITWLLYDTMGRESIYDNGSTPITAEVSYESIVYS